MEYFRNAHIHKRRKILIVDDDEVSMSFLSRILGNDYTILTARDGREALDILKNRKEKIALILLDLLMPEMDGYAFLEEQARDPRISAIPVIVTTAKDDEEDEIRCLKSGAIDFVSKPYHPEVVRRRVERIIHLWETIALLNVVEYDQLTGLYSKEFFYLEIERLLSKHPDRQYDIVVTDVENFKVINERFGVKTGDRILRQLAARYQSLLGQDGICARLHNDVFAMLVIHGDGSWKERLLIQGSEAVSGLPIHSLVVKYGVYENVDHSLPPSGMCDRAILAMSRIKNRYGVDTATYDDSLRAALLREQQILDTMEQALTERQFQVFYQPKYDIHDECVSGAEALVRWNHPEFGFMSPAEFIPLFEHNGFITRLDYYVWEEACRTLQKWKNEGRRLVPISVNVSRMDFAVDNLVGKLAELVERYGLSPELLHLEITESVYTGEPEDIIRMTGQLRSCGFVIEMDDFGSGYSSLNSLCSLPIDTLKLDMQFLQDSSDRRRSILGFIISLSKWLNLSTVAEGVEMKEQVDKLKRMGCDLVQGYYYAKPMPREAFEKYLDETSGRKPAPVVEEKPETYCPVPKPVQEHMDTILIVEDNEMNREILEVMLSPYYHVEGVVHGKAACEFLAAHPGEVSVILLDMVMPVMDGFQFMKLRNQDEALSKIPVIITSESEEDSELMALRLGADRFVGKPYRQELLLRSVEKAIGRGR